MAPRVSSGSAECCPIESFASRLVADGALTEKDVDGMREEADRIVVEAAEYADASPEPDLDSLYDHLYVVGEQVPGWYAVDERSPDPHPGEEERKAGQRAQELAERGAAYAGPGAAAKRAEDGDRPDEPPEEAE